MPTHYGAPWGCCCSGPTPPPAGLTSTFSADNGGTTIGPIVAGPASTALAATGVIAAVTPGARLTIAVIPP